MTNLQQLIERRQGYGIKEFSIEFKGALNRDPELLSGARNLATEAYRQALLDLREGLPEDDTTEYRGQRRKLITEGHNTALQTVRAQIEGLLGKIE